MGKQNVTMFRLAAVLAGLGIMSGTAAKAAAPVTPAEATAALEQLKRAIAFRSVAGPGNQTPRYAAYLKSLLLAGGFAETDVTITPFGDTAVLVARWPGTDRAAKPIVLSGHMDVVDAKPSDWTRDPFTPVVEGGFVYGRGSLDNKAGVTVMVAALTRLKAAGLRPRRTIVLALSGAEETDFASTKLIAERIRGAELVLNSDAGGGLLSEDGRPLAYGIQGAEKTYADFRVTHTDAGGHSSRPTATNPIAALGRSITAIASYQFPIRHNDLTRAFFRATAATMPNETGRAMARFAADPTDQAAAAQLSRAPEWVGQIRTTCVPTLLEGGHAPNALPQRAAATINCRIFPGEPVAAVRAKLTELAGPGATVEPIGIVDQSDASPLRPDVMAALRKAVDARAPGLPIVPQMEAGATDSAIFRGLGIASYGVGPVFIRDSDMLAHGLDERVPVESIGGGIAMWSVLIDELSR